MNKKEKEKIARQQAYYLANYLQYKYSVLEIINTLKEIEETQYARFVVQNLALPIRRIVNRKYFSRRRSEESKLISLTYRINSIMQTLLTIQYHSFQDVVAQKSLISELEVEAFNNLKQLAPLNGLKFFLTNANHPYTWQKVSPYRDWIDKLNKLKQFI